MKRATLAKRGRVLCKKDGTCKEKYKEVVRWLMYRPKEKVYPFSWRNYGRSAQDHRACYYEVLDTLGIDYIYGNDAPRGGMEGWYIKLTKKGLRQIREVRRDI